MKIVLIGSGNVATHLGKAFVKSGHEVIQVFSHTLANAEILAKKLGCSFTDEIERISRDTDVYFIALKDDSIEDFVTKFQGNGKIFIHTSGSMPMDVLKKASSNYGVLYPLQTFNKNMELDLADITIFIEANNAATLDTINVLASSISKYIFEITSEQRLTLHVAAVFANNFTNHLYKIAEDILESSGLNFSMMKPLITETMMKALNNSPNDIQTGPAKRNDVKTIQKHLELLKNFPAYKHIYEVLSESIRKQNK